MRYACASIITCKPGAHDLLSGGRRPRPRELHKVIGTVRRKPVSRLDGVLKPEYRLAARRPSQGHLEAGSERVEYAPIPRAVPPSSVLFHDCEEKSRDS